MSDGTVLWPPARSGSELDAAQLFAVAEADFARYEVIKDLVDECIDLSLNYRQSGHPGGSRSKVHMMLALLLSGAMRWDVLRPWRRFGDRFVLSAGHTVPLVYATLAVLNEAVRARHERTGAAEFAFPDDGQWALTWEWLLRLRRRGGLPGHAEMEGKTLFLKFNTGPSGHGMPPAAGEALALKLAGAGQVKVFVFEGEGGLTPGSAHETKNTAWGLGLDNLVFMVDWNDFGIDPRPASSVVAGTPTDWFAPYGWRVTGTEHGMEWGPVTQTVLEAACGSSQDPTMAWFVTQKGRGYGKVDAASHGTAWPMNAPQFWATRKGFMDRYGVAYEGFGSPAPADAGRRAGAGGREPAGGDERAAARRRPGHLAVGPAAGDRRARCPRKLTDSGSAVPRCSPTGASSTSLKYPDSMWKKPGEKAPNRAGLACLGRVRELARAARARQAAVHRGLG